MNALTQNLLRVAAVASLFVPSAQAKSLLKDGDVVEIVGDSITEGRAYSSFIEDYLLLCQPAKVRTIQYGWSGETVAGFNTRIADMVVLKPTVVTLCYGMNDGRYTAIRDDIRKAYHDGLRKGVETLKAAGATVVVGSPGCVEADAFVRPTATSAVYNVNLAALRDEAAAVAKETDSPFTDVYSPMFNAMEPVKAKFGRTYSVAGGDGVHPAANGGLAMAYAFLKGLGFDGDIGAIHVDLTAHTATADGRHTIDKVEGNAVTVTSAAYPFCFAGDPKTPNSPIGMLDFVPFNAELNRLTLTATGDAPSYKVTWGKTSKTFTADRLKAGINLAAEFLDNPFVAPFMAIHRKVLDKEGVDTMLTKGLLRSLAASHALMPDRKDALDAVAAGVPDAEARLNDDLAKSITPVTHTITLEPIQ